MITVNLDGDPAQEVVVANGPQLLVLDVVGASDAIEEVKTPTQVPGTEYDFSSSTTDPDADSSNNSSRAVIGLTNIYLPIMLKNSPP